jgi:4-carboxymuconolactone decarboxylase
MADEPEQTGPQKMFGDFAPELVHFTDDVLFGEVWPDAQLSPRDRSLVTVTSLISSGAIEQLNFHIPYAIENGVTQEELVATITHLAFYAGWPKAMSAMQAAKRLLADK